MKWSKDAEEMLLNLYDAGMSDQAIADLLTNKYDSTFTRNSVKNKRLRLLKKTKKHGTKADLYTLLKRATKPLELSDLLEKLNVGFDEFQAMVHELRSEGYNISWVDTSIELVRQLVTTDKLVIPVETLYNGKEYQFGIVADTHLGSRYERLDVLEVAYDTFLREGIKAVYLPGNMIDGYLKRINHFDLHPGMQGYTAQVEYFVENYPQREGITTYFITGDDHEGWWVKDAGINIGEYIQLKAEAAGRTDLVWIGHMEVDVELKNETGSSIMRVVHPGGGSSYAVSYSTQKLVESYQGGEKPQILIVGHYHKMLLQFIRNVWVIQAGCVEDQTPFMRKKKLAAHVGFWIIRFHQAKTGEINRLNGEFFPFYDKGFYTKKDHFKMW